jgi:hypothetical protein
MRALLHVHSTWSYDGQSTLEELAAWGAARGIDAILLTEHVNDFDQDKMERYVGEVDALRDLRCRLVPGLEFAVRGGFHILGFNLRAWTRTVEPLDAVRFIRDQGGIGVLAHPARHACRWPADEVVQQLHGIEVWNSRYDGRFFPPADVIEAARRLGERFEHLRFFGGQDLHQLTDHRLVVSEAADGRSVEGLLGALVRGEVLFGTPGFRLKGRPDKSSLVLIKLGQKCYRTARGLRDRWFGQ